MLALYRSVYPENATPGYMILTFKHKFLIKKDGFQTGLSVFTVNQLHIRALDKREYLEVIRDNFC